jgi:Fur family ferric uptake transcriptional regulator
VGDDRLAQLLALVRAHGGRVTTPRRVILSSLLDLGSHVTAEELAEHVQQRHPDIHLSTVYRTLDTLTKLEVIDHVHVGHGRAVFHMVDESHHHLACRRCGAVVEVPEALFADLARRLDDEHAFTLDRGHFALSGVCRACRDPGAPAAT